MIKKMQRLRALHFLSANGIKVESAFQNRHCRYSPFPQLSSEEIGTQAAAPFLTPEPTSTEFLP